MEEWGEEVWFGNTITMRPCMGQCQGRVRVGFNIV